MQGGTAIRNLILPVLVVLIFPACDPLQMPSRDALFDVPVYAPGRYRDAPYWYLQVESGTYRFRTFLSGEENSGLPWTTVSAASCRTYESAEQLFSDTGHPRAARESAEGMLYLFHEGDVASGESYSIHLQQSTGENGWKDLRTNSVTIDTEPPEAPLTGDDPTAEPRPLFSWTGPPDAVLFVCILDDGVPVLVPAEQATDASGALFTRGRFRPEEALEPGDYTLNVYSRDAAGNDSTEFLGLDIHVAAPLTIEAPTVTASGEYYPVTISSEPVWTWSSGGQVLKYRYQLLPSGEEPADTDWVIQSVPESGIASFTAGRDAPRAGVSPHRLEAGMWTLHVQALYDVYGWTESSSLELKVTSLPPPPTFPADLNPAHTNAAEPQWIWEYPEASLDEVFCFRYRLSSWGPEVEPVQVEPDVRSCSFAGLTDGIWTLTVSAVNSDGFFSQASRTLLVDREAPTVTSAVYLLGTDDVPVAERQRYLPDAVDAVPPGDAGFEIVFSEAMDTESVESSLSLSPSAPLQYIWTQENSVLWLTLPPGSVLEEGAGYSLLYGGNSIRDLAGNVLPDTEAAELAMSFETAISIHSDKLSTFIEDDILRAAVVRSAEEWAGGQIFWLHEIVSVSHNAQNEASGPVSSLKGISCLKNLVELQLVYRNTAALDGSLNVTNRAPTSLSLSRLLKLEQLRVLELRLYGISDPETLGMLDSLVALDIQGSSFTGLSCISRLNKLRYLNISALELESLSGFGQKSDLEVLVASHNKLLTTGFDAADLASLTQLHSLYLDQNPLLASGSNIISLADLPAPEKISFRGIYFSEPMDQYSFSADLSALESALTSRGLDGPLIVVREGE